jgi:phosphate/sulfate permease
MQLLMEHSQKGKVFSLWITYELSEPELSLVERYNIRQVILVEGNPQAEWSRARKMAGALAVLVYLAGIFWAVSHGGNDIQALLAALPLAILVFAVAVFVIRYKIRETIRVGDILNGRHFACRSIITLLEKRQQLTDMAEKFTQFLEALKNWGGREVIEMAPDRAPSARFVERPHAAE